MSTAERMLNGTTYEDTFLVDGVRTGFADYAGPLARVSATDMGIKVARAALARSGTAPAGIDTVIGANVAQTSTDAYLVPRHIGLYAGVPQDRPALLVQRICGSGFETIAQAADAIKLGKAETALCVGTESMSRNPVAAYEHRTGFALGQVKFVDTLWETLNDPASDTFMGMTAENLARRHRITREEVDEFAALSFARAIAARNRGFHAGEIVALENETFEGEGLTPRQLRLPRGLDLWEEDSHIRPTDRETLARLKPVFGGVQTGGNSSGIVDGAAAAVVAHRDRLGDRLGDRHGDRHDGRTPLARVVAACAAGVPPEIMGIGPVPAIRGVLQLAGMTLEDIDLVEVNEAFGAQVIAVERELGLDREKLNVNGGAIAIGHPLAATGLRCTITLARALRERRLRWGVASACVGGGQGIALLLENPEAA
ncbi:MAG: thiolase family protein [Azospirillaceae bacterium]